MKAIFITIGGLAIILLHDLCLISLCGYTLNVEDEEAETKKKAAALAGITALLLDIIIFAAFVALAIG